MLSGYLPDKTTISALEENPDGSWKALAAPEKPYKFCQNYEFRGLQLDGSRR